MRFALCRTMMNLRPSIYNTWDTHFDSIILERGISHDHEFERWANRVWNHGAGSGGEVSSKDFRKDITLELYNETGQLVIAYRIFRRWVSQHTALPELDANGSGIAIESITLMHEGWERDLSVTEPVEPSFDEPS